MMGAANRSDGHINWWPQYSKRVNTATGLVSAVNPRDAAPVQCL